MTNPGIDFKDTETSVLPRMVRTVHVFTTPMAHTIASDGVG